MREVVTMRTKGAKVRPDGILRNLCCINCLLESKDEKENIEAGKGNLSNSFYIINMAKLGRKAIQNYPRIEDESNVFNGFFDDSKVQPHLKELRDEDIDAIIIKAVKSANLKSSRAILNIKEDISETEIDKIYQRQGKALFKYFVKYCGDPASTAFDCINQHFVKIAKEQFRNRTIQKERMNSGWRYQFIAKDAAILTQRFNSISDIGASEADFNAVVLEIKTHRQINIYVSVKNRTNTMGGQDWPKAIRAMEAMAISDKNRTGPYLCVFGIAMDKGLRNIRNEGKTGMPYSINTEVWLSDYFWPFFTNCSYEKIIKSVLKVLIKEGGISSIDIEIPKELFISFGNECESYGLLDKEGNFNDSDKLVDLFCGKLKKASK